MHSIALLDASLSETSDLDKKLCQPFKMFDNFTYFFGLVKFVFFLLTNLLPFGNLEFRICLNVITSFIVIFFSFSNIVKKLIQQRNYFVYFITFDKKQL